MSVSKDYLAYVVEQLERVTRITTRRMFGGVGIYAETLFIALIDDDTLYFKVDGTNRPDFEAVGMEPFRPFKDAQAMEYYEVPADVLEDRGALGAWVGKTIAVARRSAATKALEKRKSKPAKPITKARAKRKGKPAKSARSRAGAPKRSAKAPARPRSRGRSR